jgi:hypothetical protein
VIFGTEPLAERGQSERIEIIVEWIGGEGRGQFIADVIGEGLVRLVFAGDLPHLPARPVAPGGVLEAVVAEEGGFRPAGCGPLGDKPVPIAHGRIEFQAKAAVDNVLDVIREMVFQERLAVAVVEDHGGIDAHLAQPLKEQRNPGGIFIGGVSHPHDDVIIAPRAELAGIFRAPCGQRQGQQEEHRQRTSCKTDGSESRGWTGLTGCDWVRLASW